MKMRIAKPEYCERIFKIALKHVKSLEDLVLIGNVIEDYQDTYSIDLIKYRREVNRIRREYTYRKRK